MQLLDRLWRMFFGWMLLSDTKPLTRADLIYVPATGIRWGGTDLLSAGKETTRKAIELYLRGFAPILVFSHAYQAYWRLEMEPKLRMTDEAGISRHAIQHLTAESEGCTSTASELVRLCEIVRKRGAQKIIVVSEEWHAIRVIKWIKVLMPGIEVESITVRVPWQAHSAHPRIKGLTTTDGIWQGWNLFWFIAVSIFPLLLRQQMSSAKNFS